VTVRGIQQDNQSLFDDIAREYDAILFMSFGGPEGKDEIIPFLENVTKGRNVPRSRLEDVAQHYYQFDGISPINEQNKELISVLKIEMKDNGLDLPVYFGNRNWYPLIDDTVKQMINDGVKRAVAFVTSGFSCYSGCRQYRENIINALDKSVNGKMEIDKIRVFYNHPGFIDAMVDRTKSALEKFDTPIDEINLVFTAHSIPMGMADNSNYVIQLHETCKLIAEKIKTENYKLAYQSRSGPPQVPWLEPDILEYLNELHRKGEKNVIVVPIGFISDHMEILFDLDTEASELAERLGLKMVRAKTVGTHPLFVKMIYQLIKERMISNPDRLVLGSLGPSQDICPVDCCLQGVCRELDNVQPKHYGVSKLSQLINISSLSRHITIIFYGE